MRTIVVHTFRVSDVDEPDLFAAGPTSDWMSTEAGKWAQEHSIGKMELSSGAMSYDYYGYKYRIIAKFNDEDATYFLLKYTQ